MRFSVLQRELKRWGKVVAVAVATWLPASGWATVTVEGAIQGPPLGQALRALAIDPTDPSTMYAGGFIDRYGDGRSLESADLYKTTNHGATWEKLPMRGIISSIAIARSNSQIIYVTQSQYVAPSAQLGNYVAVQPSIHLSRDGGATWVTTSVPLPLTMSFNGLFVDPSDAHRLYASTGHSGRIIDVMTSHNAGNDWDLVASSCGQFGGGGGAINCTDQFVGNIDAFTIDPSTASIMYIASSAGGIYRGDYGGGSWTLLSGTESLVGVSSIAVDPSDSDKLYASTNAGVMRVSVTQGNVVAALPNGSTRFPATLFFARGTPAQLYQIAPNDPQIYSLGGGVMQHFAFNAQRGAALNVQVTSNEVTISGTNGGAQAVTIVGGEYSINNGVFTSATGVINSGDKIKVRFTTALSLSTAVTSTVNIGGTVGYFTVTTRSTNRFPPEFENWHYPRWYGPVPEGHRAWTSMQMTDGDGDVPRCLSSTLPEGATLTSDASGQCVFSWTTKRGDAGMHRFTINVTDGDATTTYEMGVELTPAVPAMSAGFDEGSGTQAMAVETDPDRQSPSTLYGSLANIGWTEGVYSNALMLNGNDSTRFHLNLRRAFYPWFVPSLVLTVEAWIKPTLASQTGFAVSQAGELPDVTLAYGLGLSKGKLQGTIEDVAHASTTVVPVNVWSHVVMTWDEAYARLYLNGTQVYAAPRTVAPTSYRLPVVVVGGHPVGKYMVGAIDEVKLWSIARLPDELCAEAGRSWNGSECTGNAFGNVAPVTNSGSFAVGANDVSLGQLAATDSNNDALTYAIVRAPARGTVVIEDLSTGRFSYRAGNFPGQTDSFTFVAIDKFARSKAATVSIQIGVSSSNDHDGDGMPDAFEVARGLNPASTIDGAQDADKDGTSNYYEFIAATDPTIGEESTPEHVLGMSFSEGFGAVTTIDSTSYHHIGAVNGASWIGARRGYGLRFGGTNTVSVPDRAALDITTGITIEMWIRPTATAQNAFVAAKNVDTNTAFAYGLGLANGALRAQFGSTRYTSTFVVPVNVWTHVAVTWDGAAVHLYANGQEVFVSPRSTSLLTNNAPLLIGARSKVGGIAQGFRGDIDQVNVWRTGIAADQLCRAAGGVPTGVACAM